MQQRLYTLSRKADRAALADRLCMHLRRVEGVTVTRTNEGESLREREIHITTSACGVTASFGLEDDSHWGVFASWNFDHQTRAGRLFTCGFQSMLSTAMPGRPHHKATGPFMGSQDPHTPISEAHADVFAAIINRAMRNVLSGAAFVKEMERAS